MLKLGTTVDGLLDYFPHGKQGEPVLDQQVRREKAASGEFNLEPYDESHLEDYSKEDLDLVRFPGPGEERGYRTVTIDGKKAGVVGVIPLSGNNYVQVIIHPDFRGRGLASKVEDALIRELRLPEVYATILERNEPSLKAHRKGGWTPLSELRHLMMRQYGQINDDVVVLRKEFEHPEEEKKAGAEMMSFEDFKDAYSNRQALAAAQQMGLGGSLRAGASWLASRFGMDTGTGQFYDWSQRFGKTPLARQMATDAYKKYLNTFKKGTDPWSWFNPQTAGRQVVDAFTKYTNDPEYRKVMENMANTKGFGRTVSDLYSMAGDASSSGNPLDTVRTVFQHWRNPEGRKTLQNIRKAHQMASDPKAGFGWGEVPGLAQKFFGGASDKQKALMAGGAGLGLGGLLSGLLSGGKGTNWGSILGTLAGLGVAGYGAYDAYRKHKGQVTTGGKFDADKALTYARKQQFTPEEMAFMMRAKRKFS